MAFLVVLLQIFCVILALFYFFHYQVQLYYWPSRGLKGPTPWSLVGNFLELIWKGQPAAEMDWYRAYGKVYGMFQSNAAPALTILDHELIKQVLVQDFNSFVNRRKVSGDHEIWRRTLMSLESDDWKRVRTIVSPTFTAVKLRGMNSLMSQCIDKLAVYLDSLATKQDGVLNTKEIVSGFTIDVIASTAFATETNSNGDRSKENAFVKNGMSLMKVPYLRLLAFLVLPVRVQKMLNMKIKFEPKSFEFFVDLSRQIVKQRKVGGQNAKKRNDFVHMLIEATVSDQELNKSNYETLPADGDHEDDTEHVEVHKTEQNYKMNKATLDEQEIIAQCLIFFFAGFETTATTITFCLFELARNPEIQERLNEELSCSLDRVPTDSNQYYETVQKMAYLEAVIKETLRKYPAFLRLERRVNVDGYKLAGIELAKDDVVNIPIFAVHRIAEYYPEPERFNPDRFMPENKHLLVPYTFLPFGHGPRNCIGIRFAYQEIKLLLAKIIPKFNFTLTADTPQVVEFRQISLLSTKPFQLKVVKR